MKFLGQGSQQSTNRTDTQTDVAECITTSHSRVEKSVGLTLNIDGLDSSSSTSPWHCTRASVLRYYRITATINELVLAHYSTTTQLSRYHIYAPLTHRHHYLFHRSLIHCHSRMRLSQCVRSHLSLCVTATLMSCVCLESLDLELHFWYPGTSSDYQGQLHMSTLSVQGQSHS